MNVPGRSPPGKPLKKSTLLQLVSLALIGAMLIVPPFALHTPSYPIAVVTGNSMYPTLKPGELVVFSMDGFDRSDIANGTIIVFVETQTGMPFLDSLIAHPIIHEVIKKVTNQYGKVYYETKGINNMNPDPGLLPAWNILGVAVLKIPYAGFIILFASQPTGLVAIIAIITIFEIIGIENKLSLSRQRQRIVGQLAREVSAGALSQAAFMEMERVLTYAESYDYIQDPVLRSLNSLARKGELDDYHVIVDDGKVLLLSRKKVLDLTPSAPPRQ